MNFLIDKPHIIYLLTIPIIMLIGILSRDVILDIGSYKKQVENYQNG